MALTYSEEIKKEFTCPSFSLPSVDGKMYSLSDFSTAKALTILFICNHCPYVQAIEDRIIHLSKELNSRGVQFVGICSNDAESYPEDSLKNLLKQWKKKDYGFPYLYDEDQKVAKAFGALCTPDIFVFNQKRKLSYRGQFDDNWKNPSLVKREDLKLALLKIIESKDELGFEPRPSMGCSIKWKNEEG